MIIDAITKFLRDNTEVPVYFNFSPETEKGVHLIWRFDSQALGGGCDTICTAQDYRGVLIAEVYYCLQENSNSNALQAREIAREVDYTIGSLNGRLVTSCACYDAVCTKPQQDWNILGERFCGKRWRAMQKIWTFNYST